MQFYCSEHPPHKQLDGDAVNNMMAARLPVLVAEFGYQEDLDQPEAPRKQMQMQQHTPIGFEDQAQEGEEEEEEEEEEKKKKKKKKKKEEDDDDSVTDYNLLHCSEDIKSFRAPR